MACNPATLSKLAALFQGLTNKQLQSVKIYLFCKIAFSSLPVQPETPMNLAVDQTSTANSILITWTQQGFAEHTSVWRSQNSGAYSSIGSVGSGTTNYTDSSGMPVGSYWTYKILALNGSLQSPFSQTMSVCMDLTGANNHLNPPHDPTANIIVFPLMTSCPNVEMSGYTQMTSLLFPRCTSLGYLGAVQMDNCSSLSNLDVHLATDLGIPDSVQFYARNCVSLKTVDLFSLLNSPDALVFDGCTSLTDVTLNNYPALGHLIQFGVEIHMENCALSQQSVDNWLNCATGSTVIGLNAFLIYLDGGTSSPPSAQGLIYKNFLIAEQIDVRTN